MPRLQGIRPNITRTKAGPRRGIRETLAGPRIVMIRRTGMMPKCAAASNEKPRQRPMRPGKRISSKGRPRCPKAFLSTGCRRKIIGQASASKIATPNRIQLDTSYSSPSIPYLYTWMHWKTKKEQLEPKRALLQTEAFPSRPPPCCEITTLGILKITVPFRGPFL